MELIKKEIFWLQIKKNLYSKTGNKNTNYTFFIHAINKYSLDRLLGVVKCLN